MKANNLTICVPSFRCTRDCGFCISKMTPATPRPLKDFSYHKIQKALSFAKSAGATSVLITARGEPLYMPETVECISNAASASLMPCELQTNGDLLDEAMVDRIKNNIDVFAYSINSVEQIDKQKKGRASLLDYGKVIRWTVLLHDKNMKLDFSEWIELAYRNEVHQLSFRKLTIPPNPLNRKPEEWIKENVHNDDTWIHKYETHCSTYPVIRKLSFGPTIVAAGNIGLTYFPYCLDDSTSTEEIRSLVMREDGHIYTSWDSLASILF
jgi:organic radical activating enzyme